MKSTVELILERIDQGAATASPEGTITYANDRLAAMAGAPRQSLLGLPLARFVRAEGEQRLIRLRTPFSALRVRARCVRLPECALWLFTALAPHSREEHSDRELRGFLVSLGEEFRGLAAPIAHSLAALRRHRLDETASRELDAIEQSAAQVSALADRLRETQARSHP